MSAEASDGDFSLLNQMPVGIGVFDLDGVLVHANDQYNRLTGCLRLPSDPSGDSYTWEGRHRSGRELSIDEYPCRRALCGETVCPGVDLYHRLAEGGGRWINISAAPIVEPADRGLVGIVILATDADERARSVATAACAANRFLHFAESSRNAVWVADAATGTFDYHNRRYLELTDGAASGWSGLGDWISRVVVRDRDAVAAAYRDVTVGGMVTLEYDVAAFGGVAKRVRETCFAIPEPDGVVPMIGGRIETLAAEPPRPAVYLVGKARGPCRALAARVEALGYDVRIFEGLAPLIAASRFLAPGGILIETSGRPDFITALAAAIRAPQFDLPVAVIACEGTTLGGAVDMMRIGAADYLTAPLEDQALSAALGRLAARCARPPADRAQAEPGMTPPRLSRREQEVLDGLIGGGTNKSIGRTLGISPRTVEIHRARLMERMEAHGVAELVQAARRHGLTR